MEIEFKGDKIIFNRELSLLDSFVLDFTEYLENNKIKYVIISGYNDYLKNHNALRLAKRGSFIPNIELKFVKNDLDRYSLEHRMQVILAEKSLYLSPLELQIPFKLFLGSEKDIEDARFLFKLFKDNLDNVTLKMFLNRLKIPAHNAKKYLGDFDEN